MSDKKGAYYSEFMTKFFTGVGARIVSPYADGDRPGIGSATGI